MDKLAWKRKVVFCIFVWEWELYNRRGWRLCYWTFLCLRDIFLIRNLSNINMTFNLNITWKVIQLGRGQVLYKHIFGGLTRIAYVARGKMLILKLPDIEEQGTEFCFKKLEFYTIYNAYVKKSPFTYYISILGGRSRIQENLLI